MYKRQGLYRVSYETDKCYELINEALKNSKISDLDLFKIFIDLRSLIGSEYQKKIHIDGVLMILRCLASHVDLTEELYLSLIHI